MNSIKYWFICVKRWMKSLINITDPESYSILENIKIFSKEISEGERVLDAGAGSCPYRDYFSHTKYESTDVDNSRSIHTFTCSLDSIPKSDNTYDSIVCTQVLEHVRYPSKVIKEFYRILKPGGKLFLTVPLVYGGLHEEPNHFYNFTCFGLEALLHDAGFHINWIRPRVGFFLVFE